MLTQVRAYLQQHTQASLADMSVHFDIEIDALRPMLQKWITKGKVKKILTKPACSGCQQCSSGSNEAYLWIDNEPTLIATSQS